VPKETKDKENRIALTPEGAKQLVSDGHKVLVEKNGSLGSGFTDDDYKQAGAEIVSVEQAWNTDIVVKVKEPLEPEYKFIKENQIIFTFLHLAAAPKLLTESLIKNKTTSIAYETVEDGYYRLPLLAPMSAIAGNMSVQVAAYYLAKFNGGRGMMLGKILGKLYGKVVIIGDGIVGRHAAKTAYGLGANVFLFGRHEERMDHLRDIIGKQAHVMLSNQENISKHIIDADLVVGAVLLKGAKAPFVVTEEMVKTMQPGSVIVDVSIDQGGCIETSKPTSHSNPIFVKHGVTHYCVTNMPGAYPRTSTMALTNATFPYLLKLANKGFDNLVKENPGFAKGVNTHKGFITYKPVAEDLGMMDMFKDLGELL
ncbi:MAG: alanine dehydrogenase, partial [Candidatus Woesearchaeota archaeon]|nr:alanine dehydrogenase [Candidatus Woesearchaeota archaeon]